MSLRLLNVLEVIKQVSNFDRAADKLNRDLDIISNWADQGRCSLTLKALGFLLSVCH